MLGYLYLFFGIVIILLEFVRKKKEYIDYLTIFNLFFVMYYIVPATISNIFLDYTSRYYIYLSISKDSYYAFLLIIISYLMIFIGYSFKIKIGEFYSWKSIHYNRYIYKEERFIKVTIAILLVIGISSFLLYASLVGGVKELLLNASNIRGGFYQMTEETSSIAFISKFIICLQIASLFIYSRYLNHKFSKIKLLISFIPASIFFIVNAGRAAILRFILVIFLSKKGYYAYRISLLKWGIISVLMIAGILYLRPLLVSLADLKYGYGYFISEFFRRANETEYMNGFKNILYGISFYFEHKYVSLETSMMVIEKGQYSFNFFSDIFKAIVSIIPSMFLPFEKPSSIGKINTDFITGSELSGVIPPGGVAFGYYAMGILGVVIFSLFIGILGKRLELFFDSYNSSFIQVYKTMIMFIWVDLFINGELVEWVHRYFVYIIITAFVYKYTYKVKI